MRFWKNAPVPQLVSLFINANCGAVLPTVSAGVSVAHLAAADKRNEYTFYAAVRMVGANHCVKLRLPKLGCLERDIPIVAGLVLGRALLDIIKKHHWHSLRPSPQSLLPMQSVRMMRQKTPLKLPKIKVSVSLLCRVLCQ